MNFRVTIQYPRTEELLISEFNALTDAKIFVTERLFADTERQIKLIYRLYDDALLVNKCNHENISVAFAEYEEGNVEVSHPAQFNIHVMLQSEGNMERINIANFNNDQDASLFVIGKCKTDLAVSDNDLFIILKDTSVIDTLNKIIIANRNRKSLGLAEQDHSKIFYPHPLQMTPKPPGFSKDDWLEEITDEK